MREIKFRGITPGGKVVYGDLSHGSFTDELFIRERTKVTTDAEGHKYFETPMHKVTGYAQLVGYDKHGRELYEGDKVRNPIDGATFRVYMNNLYEVGTYEAMSE